MPSPLHSFVCANVVGRVVSNDSGVKTQSNADTVRGPDVALDSYNRVPKGPLPEGYWPAPELVFKVKPPSDRWVVYLQDELPWRHTSEEELTVPQLLPRFSVVIRRFFE